MVYYGMPDSVKSNPLVFPVCCFFFSFSFSSVSLFCFLSHFFYPNKKKKKKRSQTSSLLSPVVTSQLSMYHVMDVTHQQHSDNDKRITHTCANTHAVAHGHTRAPCWKGSAMVEVSSWGELHLLLVRRGAETVINCVFISRAGKCVWLNIAVLEIRGLVQLNQGSEAGEDSLGNWGTTKSIKL